jgi:hypothetical protein
MTHKTDLNELAGTLVFHGTTSQFAGFDDRPTFFTTDYEEAKSYARRSDPNGKVVAVHLKFANPIEMDFLPPNTARWYTNKRRVWQNKGFDSAIIHDKNDSQCKVFIAFNPSQIQVVSIHDIQPQQQTAAEPSMGCGI